MGDTYGRPSGQPKKSTMSVGRQGIDSPTTAGDKGLGGMNIPSGGGISTAKSDGSPMSNKAVIAPGSQGNRGTNDASTKAPTAKPTLD